MIAPLRMYSPRRLAFGCDCTASLATDLEQDGCKRVFFLTARVTEPFAQEFARQLQARGIVTDILSGVESEPTVEMFHETLTHARSFNADAVVGIGGGSVLDLAKLLAAFNVSSQTLEEAFGINLLADHSTRIVCVPTTAGTGSEASPNAILLDEKVALKKAVISPHLLPDATYVDPKLMLGVPPKVTAATGIDAMTHCLEAFTNRFAHPMIDLYALEGVRLAATFVTRAVTNGQDIEAREQMALASLYGGICLGPVNTAAVHALAYPLGGEFHIAHGQSIALMLPHVFRFNAVATPSRHARIALALGVAPQGDDLATALAGAAKLEELIAACGLPPRLNDYAIEESSFPALVKSAMTVTRLLKNNPREVTAADALEIYRQANL
jgi:alcohol dehydrogenase class IV